MTREEITSQVLAIKSGHADVIDNLAISRDGDTFYVEGSRNKPMSWNQAVDRLARQFRARN